MTTSRWSGRSRDFGFSSPSCRGLRLRRAADRSGPLHYDRRTDTIENRGRAPAAKGSDENDDTKILVRAQPQTRSFQCLPETKRERPASPTGTSLRIGAEALARIVRL